MLWDVLQLYVCINVFLLFMARGLLFCSPVLPIQKAKASYESGRFLTQIIYCKHTLAFQNCPSKVLFWLYSLIAEGYTIKWAYIIYCAPPPCLVSFHDFLGLLLLIVELYWQTLNWIHFIPKTGILVIVVVFAAEMLCCWFCFIWFL